MDNRQTVLTIYEHFRNHDIPAILERCAEDVVWEHWEDNRAQKAGVPWLQEQHGRDGAARFFALLDEMEFHAFEVGAVMVGDGKVAAEIRIEVTGPYGTLTDEQMHLFTFNDQGQITSFRHYLDTGKVLEGFVA